MHSKVIICGRHIVVPNLEEHSKRSQTLYGDPANEIHEYIDSGYEVYGGKHRKIRHDTQITPTEVEEIFREKHKNAKDIAIDHIVFDAMESCYKIGEAHNRAFLIKFVKNHFEETPCATCKGSRTEKFADVYVYLDWKKRLKFKGSRIIPFVSLLFTPKEPKFSDQLERWASVYYCYKCHKLGIKVIKDEDAAALLKGDTLLAELMNRILSTLRETVSNAVGHEAKMSIGSPGSETESPKESKSIYRKAYPELSEEEAELQETQEIDMDFEDEE